MSNRAPLAETLAGLAEILGWESRAEEAGVVYFIPDPDHPHWPRTVRLVEGVLTRESDGALLAGLLEVWAELDRPPALTFEESNFWVGVSVNGDWGGDAKGRDRIPTAVAGAVLAALNQAHP